MTRSRQLSDADHALVTAAVAEAERGTDGEIVTIVTDLSDSYEDTAWQWAVAIMFLGLALLAVFPGIVVAILAWLDHGWTAGLALGETLVVVFAILALIFVAVRGALIWTPLRLALTLKATRAKRVRRRALQYFRVGAESRTLKKSGVLVYLSMGEHMAEIVADEAVHKAVTPETWGEAMAGLVDHVREGRPGEGMAGAVRQVGTILAAHFPKSETDPNELPDRLIEL